jgi:hypothetical protein
MYGPKMSPTVLKYNLVAQLDEQVSGLTGERLDAAFKQLHEALDEKEKQMVDEIENNKDKQLEFIHEQIRRSQRQDKHYKDLIKEAEDLLREEPVYFESSARAPLVLDQLKATVRTANEARNNLISEFLNIKYQSLINKSAFKMAVDRIGVSYHDLMDAKRDASWAALTQRIPTAELDISQLDFSSAVRVSHLHVGERWYLANFGDTVAVGSDFRAMTGALIGDLAKTQKTKYGKDNRNKQIRGAQLFAFEYTDALFNHYNATNRYELASLKADVHDAISDMFSDMLDKEKDIASAYQGRFTSLKAVTQRTFSTGWAMFIERRIRACLYQMTDSLVPEARPDVFVLTTE